MNSKYAVRPSRQIINSEDQKALLQPLKKDGFTSDEFNQVYGEKANPYIGTDRDRQRRKKIYFMGR